MGALDFDITVPLRSFAVDLASAVGDEILGLVGPSGAGKTTVLQAIAGLVRPTRGRIALDQEVWFDAASGRNLPAERRATGVVFQDYALFPHLTVRDNVEFGARSPVDDLLDRFQIAHLAGSRPAQLSGGERQRVGLARALARDPRVLLLDEPMAALDASTRLSVRHELRDLLRGLRLPTILVSHDFGDAEALVERVAVLVEGRIVQIGSPDELVSTPAHPFVARFTGANLLQGWASDGSDSAVEVTLPGGARLRATSRLRGRVGVVVYPWEVELARAAPAGRALNVVAGPIERVAPVGNRVRVTLGGLTADVSRGSATRLGIEPGVLAFASFTQGTTRLVPMTGGVHEAPAAGSLSEPAGQHRREEPE